MTRADATTVPPHPTRGSATALVAIGGAVAAASVAAVPVLGAAGLGVGAAGATLAVLGWRARVAGAGVQILNQAANALQCGDLPRAEGLLSLLDRGRTLGYIRRTADLHRGTIAMRRGDLAASVAALDAAVQRPLGWTTREQERWHITEGRGLRAFVHAAAGDGAAAREDVAAVRASEHASPHALANAELAEAMALEREGDRARLAAHLTRHRTLLFEHTSPRQRAIVRAYQRLVRSTSTTVYRTAAPRGPEPRAADEPTLADWVSMVAPSAAPFVRAPAKHAAPPLDVARGSVASDASESVRGAAAARFGKASRAPQPLKVVALWAVLIVMFLAIWQLMSPGPADVSEVEEVLPKASFVPDVGLLVLLFVAIFAGLFAWQLRRFRRSNRELSAAFRLLATGELERARFAFETLAKGRLVLVAAQADASLASIAARRGQWTDALALCDRGIARLRKNEQTRVAAADILLPSLHAERARALAALDKSAEATTEISLLAQTFPAFPFLSLARHRVALMDVARRGDVATVARLAESAGEDLPLDVRDDLLSEAGRLAASPDAPEADVQRLRDELRADPDTRRWLEHVAPTILSAFDHRTTAAAESSDDEAEAEAEREAQAEAEAEAAPRREVGVR